MSTAGGPGKPRLQRKSLAKQVADDLIHKIVRRQLSRGEALLPEQALAAEYDVSRPIVREALRTLEGQGYVEIRRGRGAVVTEPHARTLESFFTWVLHGDSSGWTDLMTVRRVLEIESVRLAAGTRSDEDLRTLRDLLLLMEGAWDDPAEYSRLDIQFHIAIAQITHNDFLAYLIESIRGSLTELLTHLRVQLPLDMRAAVQAKHEEIFAALRDSREDRAAAAMAQHFDDVVDRLGRMPPLVT